MYQLGFRWDGFLQNLVLEAIIKICQENLCWIKIRQKITGDLHEDISSFLLPTETHIAQR
jgi:hypothetical protein